ncbi:hypothetical protein ASZ90_002089 [hydrocarbon metagenome]|uniref:Uncharacterized protein n=1 Tax=hydrocarbon metagenome TaxID=938273 RepID=A0A0W8G4E1_9ZZZZ
MRLLCRAGPVGAGCRPVRRGAARWSRTAPAHVMVFCDPVASRPGFPWGATRVSRPQKAHMALRR